MDPREAKLQAAIERGKQSVAAGLKSIAEEFELRQDRFVKPAAIDYAIVDNQVKPEIQGGLYRLTDHSRGQLYARAGIPVVYADKLMEIGEHDLLKENLQRLTVRQMGEGVLVRSVRDLIKGWLSPSYKRMDASPVLEAFVERAVRAGFVPYRGMNTDFRYQVAMIYPKVYQAGQSDFFAFGISLTTGDYGTQALEISLMILRITCLNLAMGMDLFRKVHLGSRFHTDQEAIELSKRTYMLDHRTVVSAVGDVVDHSIKQVGTLEAAINNASGTEIKDPSKYYDILKKKGVQKAVVDKVKGAYEMSLEVELLPKESSVWRMSNAISMVAGGLEGDKKIDLEHMAFDLLDVDLN